MLAIFLDIETTGLDSVRHRPIDLALKVLDMTTGEIRGKYQSLIIPLLMDWVNRDPMSMEINGYTWEEVSQGKNMAQVKEEILQLFQKVGIIRGKSVFICQNPAFDRGFFSQIIDVYTQEKLNWPYHWLDFASMYWAKLAQKSIQEHQNFPETLNLSKNEIARIHGLSTEVSPHKAMNGVDHLILCYKTVIGLPKSQ